MSDTTTQGNNRRRRNRGGRNRGSQSSRPGSTPRAGHQEPSALQKFLSFISGGLLGKPKTLPRPAVSQPRTGAQASSRSGSDSSTRSSERPPRDREPREPREPKPRREPASVN
ncbi:MAG TPA: hypothetical protein VGE29_06015, partial [Prosthecobacter sp.]